MTIALVALSTITQGVAACLAIRLAWSMRRPTWLALSLAVVLMLVRRVITLYDAVFAEFLVDPSAEVVALATSTLMLAGLVHLGRIPPFSPSRSSDRSVALRPTMLRRLSRVALALGFAGILGSFGVGLYAYRSASDAHRDASSEQDLRSLPWATRFALVLGVLGPLSLGSLHWAYRRAARAARRAEVAYRQSEGRLGMVVAGSPLVLFAVDKDGLFTLSEGRGLEALGLRPGDVVGQSVFALYGDHPQIVEGIQRAYEGHEISNVVEVAGRWFDSHYAPLRDEQNAVTGVLGVAHDITEFKRIESELAQQALRDPLTRLPNRLLFTERLDQAIRRASMRDDRAYAVLFIDLDRFKLINDSLGHMLGDELLVAIARTLEDSVRPADTVARLGGDEFTILLEGIDQVDQATKLAVTIQKRLRQPFSLSGHEVFTTASIGIASSANGYSRPQDVLRDADTAMYRAKALGRARHVVFDRQMHLDAVELLHLDTGLRRALERNELRVNYQPIVSLATGKLAGFEALLRWHHPERGVVLPDDFMRVAEETGLIVPIGRWVLGEACAQASRWKQRHPTQAPLTMVVNLSGREWLQPDLVDYVENNLAHHALTSHDLKLELTENVLIENTELVTRTLKRLRELEIHVYIDDFGTGYSSLSTLHTFPIDALKIDRSFVSRMGPKGQHIEIVRSIVTLGHHLGKYIVAEGVEAEHQLEQLRSLDCEYGQGHLFSQALDELGVDQLIASNPTW